jgi:hypothetical protein
MNPRRWSSLALVAVVCAGCAESMQPTVYAYPLKGQSAEQQMSDRENCEAWAKQQTGFDPVSDTAMGVGAGTVLGALIGAAAGAAIGAATGNAGQGAAIGAATGGIGGAAIGGAQGYSRNREGYDHAYSACIVARGYSVGGASAAAEAMPSPPGTAQGPGSTVAASVRPPTPGMVELTVAVRPAQVRRGETIDLEVTYRIHAPAGQVTVQERRTVTFNGSLLPNYPVVAERVRADGPHVSAFPQKIPAEAEPGTYRYEGLVCVGEQCVLRAASFQVLP